MEGLLLSLQYQAPPTWVGPWRQRERNCWRLRQSISTSPSWLISLRKQLMSSYWMTRNLASLVITPRPFLLPKLKRLQATSGHQRTQVHTHLLRGSEPQKKWRRARLLVRYLLPRRYEVFASDYEWVQSVMGSLLGLEAGNSPSRRKIEESCRF